MKNLSNIKGMKALSQKEQKKVSGGFREPILGFCQYLSCFGNLCAIYPDGTEECAII